ncbi:MAG: hypothetical protein J7521_20435 [Caulobacter sp.]|nr:hypothetical protein [Caulobacter sp.]
MVDRVPHDFASPGVLRWGLVGSFISGGQTIYGETQERRTDGGGAWQASFQSIPILTTADARAWEAMMLRFHLGDTKVIVPRCAGRMKADFSRPAAFVPHSDETPFSDEMPYASALLAGSLSSDISLRATIATIVLEPGYALVGGESFTMTGPKYGDRLYGVASVLSQSGGVATVRFGPPAREAYAAGTVVDFADPRCVMRAQLADGADWGDYDTAWHASTSIVFRETFR